ncbi:MAG: hypothetical protein WAO41_09730, partial [Candidatus Nanopelagicales bacterium]
QRPGTADLMDLMDRAWQPPREWIFSVEAGSDICGLAVALSRQINVGGRVYLRPFRGALPGVGAIQHRAEGPGRS